MIDDCDTGVEDTGGIQDGIDACEADARNHGQFVRCVARFTRSEGMSQADRRPVMSCASHSSIGKPGAASPSSRNAVETVKAEPVKAAPPVVSTRSSRSSARADRRERLRERIARFRARYGR